MKKKEKNNIDAIKDINIDNLSKNPLESLEEIVKFLPRKSKMFKDVVREILIKKHMLTEN